MIGSYPSLNGTVNLPSAATSLSVVARASSINGCIGAPIRVLVDGKVAIPVTSIKANAGYTSINSVPLNLVAGNHALSIRMDTASNFCKHTLIVDVTNFYGPANTNPPPTVSISATPNQVTSGSSSTITWTSTNASSCTASGAWSGTEQTQGTYNTGALNTNATYNLSCTGPGGTATGSAPVTVEGGTVGTGPAVCNETLSPSSNLSNAISSAPAGSVICLSPGSYTSVIDVESDNGTSGHPVTITSANYNSEAVIDNQMGILTPASWLTFTKLDFNWSMPMPWDCLNSGGDGIPNEIISTPYSSGQCQAGTPNSDDFPSISISGANNTISYDTITNNNTDICINVVDSGGNPTAQSNVIDHDTIYNCGPLVSGYFATYNQDPGWHDHGIYDYGTDTQITNNYIYGNSRNGILEYPSGSGATIEHNIIDDNGNGIDFNGNKSVVVKYNIITNSTSPLGVKQGPSNSLDYGVNEWVNSNGTGTSPGTVFENNCLGGNLSGDIVLGPDITQANNLTGKNPLYANVANHDYTLSSNSPCLGDGPDTAQP